LCKAIRIGNAGWDFVPAEREEILDLLSKLKLIIDTEAIWFVEDEGKPIGCALGYPDIKA